MHLLAIFHQIFLQDQLFCQIGKNMHSSPKKIAQDQNDLHKPGLQVCNIFHVCEYRPVQYHVSLLGYNVITSMNLFNSLVKLIIFISVCLGSNIISSDVSFYYPKYSKYIQSSFYQSIPNKSMSKMCQNVLMIVSTNN